MQNIDLSTLSTDSLSTIAAKVRADHRNQGKKIYFGAVPYLEALECLGSINENYGADTGKEMVAYFLSNATTWKGDVARAVKAELNKRLKAKK